MNIPTYNIKTNLWTIYKGHRLDEPFVRLTDYHPSKDLAIKSLPVLKKKASK